MKNNTVFNPESYLREAYENGLHVDWLNWKDLVALARYLRSEGVLKCNLNIKRKALEFNVALAAFEPMIAKHKNARARAQFETPTTEDVSLRAVAADLEPSDSLSIYKDAEQLEASHRQGEASQAAEETSLEVWHLNDPSWRDERIMTMGEWHPCFRKVERKFKLSTSAAWVVLKEYAEILLSTSPDSSEDLLRHLHEEVVTYLANKLVESVDRAWREVEPTVVRPTSPVREFEGLIDECRQMSV